MTYGNVIDLHLEFSHLNSVQNIVLVVGKIQELISQKITVVLSDRSMDFMDLTMEIRFCFMKASEKPVVKAKSVDL